MKSENCAERSILYIALAFLQLFSPALKDCNRSLSISPQALAKLQCSMLAKTEIVTRLFKCGASSPNCHTTYIFSRNGKIFLSLPGKFDMHPSSYQCTSSNSADSPHLAGQYFILQCIWQVSHGLHHHLFKHLHNNPRFLTCCLYKCQPAIFVQ